MNVLFKILIVSCSIIFCTKHSIAQIVENALSPVVTEYTFHDSQIIMGSDSNYYAFASCVYPRHSCNLPMHYFTVSIFKSEDLHSWFFYKYALPPQSIEQKYVYEFDKKHKYSGRFCYVNKEGEKTHYSIWAPDIILYKGKYLLYVALHLSVSDSKIAVFESESLNADFTYKGVVVSTDSKESEFVDSEELIDPYPIIEGEDIYLIYGSFSKNKYGKGIVGREKVGVYIVKLDKDGVTMKNAPVFLTNYYEGVSVIKHNGKFYLFGTNGEWKNHTYQVSYAVSNKIDGPYTNNLGKSICDTVNWNPATIILKTSREDKCNGFGCPTRPIEYKGELFVLLHGHDLSLCPILQPNAKEERYPFLFKLKWNNEIPYYEPVI